MSILSSTNTGKKSVELNITNIVKMGYDSKLYVLSEPNTIKYQKGSYPNIHTIYYDSKKSFFWTYLVKRYNNGVTKFDKIIVKSMIHLNMIEKYRNIFTESKNKRPSNTKINNLLLQIDEYLIKH
jgi:hypothetical protein